jgi:alkanesulfonate monooxygenase SsuD/methylene tetrahydromethanopterin reductase-like flavin-dependent oxidoreductase (luciferase family)
MALPAPLFQPFYLAKGLATLDHLSSGRLDVGLGIGWHPEEFAALGHALGSVKERARELESCLDVLEDGLRPSGEQHPHPPWWLAGSGATVLGVAARRADWVNFARGISPTEFTAAVHKLRTAEGEVSRQRPVRLSLTGTFIMGNSDEVEAIVRARAHERRLDPTAYRSNLIRSGAFVGTPVEISDQLKVYAGLGCEAFILWPLDGRWRAAISGLEEVAGNLTSRNK